MADTPLPSVATVTPDQLAAMLEVYGTAEGYKAAMIKHILADIRQFKQRQIQAVYKQRLDELNAQEAAALASVEALLQNLTGNVP
jgi:hypothetical protein